jgi:hypothetical protein
MENLDVEKTDTHHSCTAAAPLAPGNLVRLLFEPCRQRRRPSGTPVSSPRGGASTIAGPHRRSRTPCCTTHVRTSSLADRQSSRWCSSSALLPASAPGYPFAGPRLPGTICMFLYLTRRPKCKRCITPGAPHGVRTSAESNGTIPDTHEASEETRSSSHALRLPALSKLRPRLPPDVSQLLDTYDAVHAEVKLACPGIVPASGRANRDPPTRVIPNREWPKGQIRMTSARTESRCRRSRRTAGGRHGRRADRHPSRR